MKISFIFIFCVFIQLGATNSFAQHTRKSMKTSGASIEQLMTQIEHNSDYVFLCNDKTVDTHRTVSVRTSNRDLNVILNEMFAGTNISYKIVNKQIILTTSHYPATATAQQQKGFTVRGTVKDEKGEPLIGVNVQNKRSGNGAITDANGNFAVKAEKGDVLTISYVGYVSKTMTVGGNQNISLVLQENAKVLNEVVVTALGIKRQTKALSYNVQEVKGDELTTLKDANFMNSLAGKVAGVNINTSAVGAGGAVRVIMRGTKSIAKDDNALYVIDGIPMFNINSGDAGGGTMNNQPGSSSVADINPEDIESMSILTGPSAAALYGSEAANGVVIINTKKGQAGKVKITYSNSTTFSRPFVMPKFQNSYGNALGENVSWGNKLENPSSFDPKDFFRTGNSEINSLTFSTGTEKNMTYASMSSTNARGIMPNNTYNRYNFSVRNTAKFLKDKLTLDIGAQYIIQNEKNMVGNGQYFNPLVALYLFPRGENFQEVRMFERYDEARNIMTQYWPTSIFGSELDMQNPYWIMNRMLDNTQKKRSIYNVSLKYDVAPWLNIVARAKVDNSNFDNYRKRYASTNATFTEGSSKGFYGHSKQNDRSFYGDVIATITKNYFDDRFSINANIGASINDQKEDAFYNTGGLENVPNFFHIGNISKNRMKRGESEWHDQTQGVFGSLELGWDRAIFLTVTGRNDWASQLAFTDKKSYFYPSVGLSAVISELCTLPAPISYLKLRASWAEVASAPSRYLTRKQYAYSDMNDSYVYPSAHWNTNLKPENTRSYEFGMNAKFWKNRINLDVTYYNSNTYHQTFYVDASKSSGYDSNIVQTGNIRNRGIELALGYNGPITKDIHLTSNFTYTLNQNKIINLLGGAVNPETGEDLNIEYYAKGTLGVGGGPVIRMYQGGTMGDLYTNQRLRQSPNGYIWVDPKSGEVEVETTDYHKIGSILPKYNLGWNNTISWKDLSVGFAFAGRVGGLVVSDTQAFLDRYGVSKTSAEARDNGGISINNGKVSARNYYETVSQAIGTYYTYSATNVRLSELTINYRLPRKWFANKLDMTLGVTGKNLWMIYCKAPFDPEATSATSNNFYQGVDYFQQPSMRSFGFNVKLSF